LFGSSHAAAVKDSKQITPLGETKLNARARKKAGTALGLNPFWLSRLPTAPRADGGILLASTPDPATDRLCSGRLYCSACKPAAWYVDRADGVEAFYVHEYVGDVLTGTGGCAAAVQLHARGLSEAGWLANFVTG